MLQGLDLFSGIGGISLGLKQWVRPVAYCEVEPYAAAVLFGRMLDGSLPKAPIFPDIRHLHAGILPPIDIIYGGFPCQDVSLAGARKGLEGERTGLFFEAIRLIRECRPQFVFLENVGGIRRFVPRIRRELEAIGFNCRDGFLSAAEIGAPHRRNRWWLLANACGNRGQEEQIRQQGCQDKTITWDDGKESFLANSHCVREQQPQGAKQNERRWTCNESWWSSEPILGRVANGIPNRMDRLKCLGNAVVPAQAKKAFEILMGIKAKHCLRAKK